MNNAGTSLPEGYTFRAPVPADLQAVTEVIRACEVAESGAAEQTVDDLRADWERPRFDLAKDAWVAVAPDGSVVAYAEVWPRADGAQLDAFGYVLSEHCGRGIGSALVGLMEARARERAAAAPAGAAAGLFNVVNHGNEAARQLLELRGYETVRHYWRLAIDLGGRVPAPAWPAGVRVRTFEPEDARVVYETVQEAFADNEGFIPYPFEEWAAFMMARATFDPTQWFLAVEGGEVAGVALCPEYGEQGWVRQLAVRRNRRRRGIALALLWHAFTEFRARGKTRAGLVTDSYNRSGSLALYEKAGMRVDRQHDAYRLETGGQR